MLEGRVTEPGGGLTLREQPLRLAVDIGGTFVDAVELDTATGGFRFRKAPTTPRTPSQGVLDRVSGLGTPLERAALFTHGTTLGLNAVLERRGARVGIITNEGFATSSSSAVPACPMPTCTTSSTHDHRHWSVAT